MTQEDTYRKGQRDKSLLAQRFGFVPRSILRMARGTLTKSMHNYADEQADTNKVPANVAHGLRNVRQRNRLSIMPAEWVDFFVKYYALPGAVYLDPFAGQGVQMQVAILRGLSYYASDLNEDFVAYANAVRARLDITDGTTVDVRCRDSRDPSWIPDSVGDFCFTSPPYWDLEDYGDAPGQLGDNGYDAFLAGLGDVFRAWHPKFKPGAYVVVNVNDLRRDQAFISFHADTISVMRCAGYTMHDIGILDLDVAGGRGAASVFSVAHNMRRTLPKTHEYALVFRP